MRRPSLDPPCSSTDPKRCAKEWMKRMVRTGVCDLARDTFKRRVASLRCHLSASDVERIASEICARSGTRRRSAKMPSSVPRSYLRHIRCTGMMDLLYRAGWVRRRKSRRTGADTIRALAP
jgi:hypothetical protein